jgi:hypothetical protein
MLLNSWIGPHSRPIRIVYVRISSAVRPSTRHCSAESRQDAGYDHQLTKAECKRVFREVASGARTNQA